MRALTLRAVLTIVLAAGATSNAGAVTLAELVELTRAGLGDEVLVALVETDAAPPSVDAAGLVELQRAGVSEAVLAALVRRGAEPATWSVGCQDCETTPVEPAVKQSYVTIPWWYFYHRPHHPHRPPPAPQPAAPAGPLYDNPFGRFLNDGFTRPPFSAPAK